MLRGQLSSAQQLALLSGHDDLAEALEGAFFVQVTLAARRFACDIPLTGSEEPLLKSACAYICVCECVCSVITCCFVGVHQQQKIQFFSLCLSSCLPVLTAATLQHTKCDSACDTRSMSWNVHTQCDCFILTNNNRHSYTHPNPTITSTRICFIQHFSGL